MHSLGFGIFTKEVDVPLRHDIRYQGDSTAVGRPQNTVTIDPSMPDLLSFGEDIVHESFMDVEFQSDIEVIIECDVDDETVNVNELIDKIDVADDELYPPSTYDGTTERDIEIVLSDESPDFDNTTVAVLISPSDSDVMQ
eukprot:Selendium_serpulae@DN7995_c0_g1_i1.p2